eukprot:4082371-Karenia_brevis.AAC.1
MYLDGHRKCLGMDFENVLGWTSKINWDGLRKCIGMNFKKYNITCAGAVDREFVDMQRSLALQGQMAAESR